MFISFLINSFSGNRADLLRNKICFVKGIVDFLYPKLVLNKMILINKIKQQKFKDGLKSLQKDLVNQYYVNKHRSPEQNANFSKYLFSSELELKKHQKKLVNIKKTFINNCIVSKLACKYDYFQ